MAKNSVGSSSKIIWSLISPYPVCCLQLLLSISSPTRTIAAVPPPPFPAPVLSPQPVPHAARGSLCTLLRSRPSSLRPVAPSETGSRTQTLWLTRSYRPAPSIYPLSYPLGAGLFRYIRVSHQSLCLARSCRLKCLSPQICTVHSLISAQRSFLRKVFLEPCMACGPDTI